jgi:hypothetical protein
VRPTPILSIPFLLAALLLLTGCSRKVDTIVGNERLIRGPQGLGTTSQYAPASDQDTYMTPTLADRGHPLLVARQAPASPSTFEARTLLAVHTWTVPDVNLSGFTVDSVTFTLSQELLRRQPGGSTPSLSIQLSTTTDWDSTSVTWPGPAPTVTLGTVDFGFIGPLRFDLGPGFFTQIQSWASVDTTVGFVLRVPSDQGAAGFQPLSGVFHVYYSYINNGVPATAVADTRVLRDVYVNSPVNPAPSLADTSMMLGGGYQAAVAVRVPIPSSIAGYSLAEARLSLFVNSTFPAIDGTVFTPGASITDSSRVACIIEAYRIRGDWTEGTTSLESIDRDVIPFAFIIDQTPAPGDSILIPVPQFIIREWTDFPDRNKGMLVSMRSANVKPGLFVASRESVNPPVLRLAYTSPPPYRF